MAKDTHAKYDMDDTNSVQGVTSLKFINNVFFLLPGVAFKLRDNILHDSSVITIMDLLINYKIYVPALVFIIVILYFVNSCKNYVMHSS